MALQHCSYRLRIRKILPVTILELLFRRRCVTKWQILFIFGGRQCGQPSRKLPNKRPFVPAIELLAGKVDNVSLLDAAYEAVKAGHYNAVVWLASKKGAMLSSHCELIVKDALEGNAPEVVRWLLNKKTLTENGLLKPVKSVKAAYRKQRWEIIDVLISEGGFGFGDYSTDELASTIIKAKYEEWAAKKASSKDF